MAENGINPSSGTNPQQGGMSPKTIGIVAYITLIGWVVALVMNQQNKDEHASFHIRQMLGIAITGFASGIIMIIPLVGWIVGIVGYLATLVFWIMGIISAANGTQKPVPVLGEKYQEWFASL